MANFVTSALIILGLVHLGCTDNSQGFSLDLFGPIPALQGLGQRGGLQQSSLQQQLQTNISPNSGFLSNILSGNGRMASGLLGSNPTDSQYLNGGGVRLANMLGGGGDRLVDLIRKAPGAQLIGGILNQLRDSIPDLTPNAGVRATNGNQLNNRVTPTNALSLDSILVRNPEFSPSIKLSEPETSLDGQNQKQISLSPEDSDLQENKRNAPLRQQDAPDSINTPPIQSQAQIPLQTLAQQNQIPNLDNLVASGQNQSPMALLNLRDILSQLSGQQNAPQQNALQPANNQANEQNVQSNQTTNELLKARQNSIDATNQASESQTDATQTQNTTSENKSPNSGPNESSSSGASNDKITELLKQTFHSNASKDSNFDDKLVETVLSVARGLL